MRPRSRPGVRIVSLTCVVTMLLFVLHHAQAKDLVSVNIGTGGSTGLYFVVGSAICRLVHKEAEEGQQKPRKHGIRCAASATSGSTYNLGNIKQGEMDFGVVQSDWQHHAFHGTDRFTDDGFEDLRSLFSVYTEPFHLIVGRTSEISGWADLVDKRVSIGNPGSGQRATLEVLMKAHGMSVEDFRDVSELNSTEQPRALCRGKIDAYGYTVGVPSVNVAVATDGCGGQIINLDGPVEKKLVAQNSFYTFTTIPKGTYKTTKSEVTTFGVMATLVTSAHQSADIVYEIVRAVFENFGDFKKLHPAFADLEPAGMIRDGLSAPLHPGAIRYYHEKGWMEPLQPVGPNR